MEDQKLLVAEIEADQAPYSTKQMSGLERRISNSPSSDTEETEGLRNPKALIFLALWYIFSTLTLFLNKWIIDMQKGDPGLLGVAQMVMTVVGGAFHLYFPCGLYKPSAKPRQKPNNFYKNMVFVGGCRFMTVILGLIALEYIAVSFTETVKSSAPIFTVLIAKIILGETTTTPVLCSLIPIMAGLALTSAYELSFNFYGLLFALGTNLTECIQNVYSKMLLSASEYKYNPAEMQFYTSLCSMVVNIPVAFLMIDFPHVYSNTDMKMAIALILNGACFHGQTISAYGLMGYISPVTHSVANTVKRALMIWLSVLVFGNPVTVLAGVGMILVSAGVFIYNKAREREAAIKIANSKNNHQP